MRMFCIVDTLEVGLANWFREFARHTTKYNTYIIHILLCQVKLDIPNIYVYLY
jgi:hypothetical protein